MQQDSTTATGGRRRSQEIRLGLVMYGGVSLAIYIFGVAQEFFRAVRGRGAYRLLKDLTDSDIVVDILSGTSAGGVNGVLLAYALANEREFSDCNRIWRDAGDLLRLIHEPQTPAQKVRSVLDSEFYLAQMQEALATMRRIQADHEDASPVKELDLFITGTDVDGSVYTWLDSQGHAVDVKDHRAVFMLKHRAGRKTPFAPGADTHLALAKLARITSCFPVAFEPVKVGGGGEDAAADALLRLWGSLNPNRVHYFLDGGVLDNKPFSYTIREIFYRMTDRKVDRKLFYVEPDPERFAAEGAVPAREPSVPEAALKSLISIPGYESISDDLKLIAARNEKLRRYSRVARALERSPALTPDTERCVARMQARERGEPVPGEDAASSVYFQTRLVELSERVVQGVLRESGQRVQLDPAHKDAAERLFEAFDQWLGTGEDTLLRFDVYFRLRRVFDVMYRAYESAAPQPGGGAESERTQRILYALGRQIELLDVLQSAMERLLDEAPFRWMGRAPAELWMDVQSALALLLDPRGLLPAGYDEDWARADPGHGWLDQAALSAVHGTLRRRVEDLVGRLERGEPIAASGTLRTAFAATDACERRMMRTLALPPKLDLPAFYERFMSLDAQTLPLEFFGDLREKDIIQTIRVSPFDAQRGFSNRPGGDKVSGDVLHHFGGFLKRSWRSNDIMWGRLDGLCQLFETLLTPLRIREVIQSSLRDELLGRLGDPTYLETVFPAAPVGERETVAADLRRLLTQTLPPYDKDHPDRFERAFRQQYDFDALLDRLIRAAQADIVQEEVPRVITDAVQQQAQWNQYRFTEKQKAKALQGGQLALDPASQALYRTGPGQLDPLVVAAASEQLARAVAGQPGQAVALFANHGYRVGGESVAHDVPPTILLELGAKALLSLRKATLSTVSETTARRIQGSAANWWLGFVLWAFYGFAGFVRRSGPAWKFLVFGLAILAVLALIVGIKWWTPIVYSPSDGVSLVGLVVFIVVPALVLVIEVIAFALAARGYRNRA
jgi:patatin-related protein